MQKYLTARSLKEAEEYKDNLIRSANINAWIETVVRAKEYRVHPGEEPKSGKVIPPGKIHDELLKD